MTLRSEDEVIAKFFESVANNDVGSVEAMLQSGLCNANYVDGDDITGLHIAAGCGNLQMVKVLLNHRANPNACDILNATPLFHAAAHGCTEVVEELVAAGANIAHISGAQTDVISIAIAYRNFEIVKLLHSTQPKRSRALTAQRRLTVLAACLTNDIDMVLYFTLFWRSDIDNGWPVFEGINALGLAVFMRNADLVELLLDLGASPFARSLNGLNAVDMCDMLDCGQEMRLRLTKCYMPDAQKRINKRVEKSPLRSAIIHLSPRPRPKTPSKSLLSSYSSSDFERIFSTSSRTNVSGEFSSSLVSSVSESSMKMMCRFSGSDAPSETSTSFSASFERSLRIQNADDAIDFREAAKINDDKTLISYMKSSGLGHYTELFAAEGVDLEVFLCLREKDLASLGIKGLDDRSKMTTLIGFLNAR